MEAQRVGVRPAQEVAVPRGGRLRVPRPDVLADHHPGGQAERALGEEQRGPERDVREELVDTGEGDDPRGRVGPQRQRPVLLPVRLGQPLGGRDQAPDPAEPRVEDVPSHSGSGTGTPWSATVLTGTRAARRPGAGPGRRGHGPAARPRPVSRRGARRAARGSAPAGRRSGAGGRCRAPSRRRRTGGGEHPGALREPAGAAGRSVDGRRAVPAVAAHLGLVQVAVAGAQRKTGSSRTSRAPASHRARKNRRTQWACAASVSGRVNQSGRIAPSARVSPSGRRRPWRGRGA